MKLATVWRKKSRTVITYPITNTKSGPIRGFSITTKKGPVNVYLGIPYAEPPVGALRFKKTVPVKPWKDVKDCKSYKWRAPQKDFFWDRLRVGKNEDCLYLNIIAPGWKQQEEHEGYPVLFFIHGGGYLCDSAVTYKYSDIAKLLVVHDIIVVTIQYRLGYLGFFCTGDDNCKGNFGLWDQVTALQWIHRNIEFFGGDPKRITVSGQSAGATSADLLSLSPYSRDLFNQMILMGGSAESSWAVCNMEKIVDYCKKHARKLGWSGDNTAELMSMLSKVPAHKLADGMIGNKTMFRTATLPLGPIIDGDLLPRSIDELRTESQPKRTIMGICESEGLLFVALGGMKCDKNDIDFGIDLISHAVERMGIDVSDVVQNVYVKGNLTDMSREAVMHTFVNMLDDVVSNFACSNYVDKIAARGETAYMYCLEHCNPASYGLLNLFMPFRAATHGTELLYLFNVNCFLSPFRRTANDKKVARIMTTLCSNFIKSGDPNSKRGSFPDDVLDFDWKPVSKDVDFYLRIAPDCRLEKNLKGGRLKELRKIFGSSRLPI